MIDSIEFAKYIIIRAQNHNPAIALGETKLHILRIKEEDIRWLKERVTQAETLVADEELITAQFGRRRPLYGNMRLSLMN
jgi:hypothetical protein